MANTIGANIKARRQELKLTQRELAARVGYTDHTTITRIEAGRTDLPQSRIAQFAKALNTTPGQLMGWHEEPEDMGALAAMVLTDPGLLQLVQTYQTLSEADRYALQLMADSLAAKNKKD